MRGEVSIAHVGRLVNRITPAHAGRRRPPLCSIQPPQDHPRACGEKISRAYSSELVIGSPPRMRGEAKPTPGERSDGRITPAHAGRRILHWQWAGIRRDHPRACGEKRQASLSVMRNLGSPPRMRGEVKHKLRARPCARITPAHAGRSENSRLKWPKSKDHPRACGEKHTDLSSRSSVMGSPPRMRGEVTWQRSKIFRIRITPAHAGRSFWR